MKKPKNEEIACVCANCEYAVRHEDDEETVLCQKKKKEVPAFKICRRFVYDVLKHTPPPPREIPTIDPSLIEI